jgi:hypothetical protein
MNINKYISDVVEVVRTDGIKSAVKYVSTDLVIKATKRSWSCAKHTEILLCIGKPNFYEREFIKRCKKVGEKFPVRKIQIKFVASERVRGLKQ